jgi:hypothetical protein
MRVVGFMAGVGSLLREAQDAGLDVAGNIEPRSAYHTGRHLSWDLNFPETPLHKSIQTRLGESFVVSLRGCRLGARPSAVRLA